MNKIIGHVYNMVGQRDQRINYLEQENATYRQENATYRQKEAALTQENAELRRLLALKDKQDI
jgi:cell shape-determining protein MreC